MDRRQTGRCLGVGAGGMGSDCLKGMGSSLGGDKNVVGLDTGGGGTTL